MMNDPIEVLQDTIRACTRCHLHANHNGPVPYRGPLNPLILVIGEAPGDNEDQDGKPFVGKAGKYLMYALIEAGCSLKRVGYTNVICCHPGRKGNSYRTPAFEERAACGGNLDMTIAMVQPKLALLCGGTAIQTFRPDMTTVKSARGRPFCREGLMMIPTYHPAAALRAHPLKPKFEKDVRHAYWRSKRVGKGEAREFDRWPKDCWLCPREGVMFDEDGVVYCDFHARTRDLIEDGSATPQTLAVD